MSKFKVGDKVAIEGTISRIDHDTECPYRVDFSDGDYCWPPVRDFKTLAPNTVDSDWASVYGLCRELGMGDSGYGKGRADVMGFIRDLHDKAKGGA